MGKRDNNTKKNSEKVAEKMYESTDYNNSDELSKGLATTHEQVSDAYVEGTIDGSIDDVNRDGQLSSDKGEKIKRKGYDEE